MGSGKYQRLVATTAPASGAANQRFCSGSEAPPGGGWLAWPCVDRQSPTGYAGWGRCERRGLVRNDPIGGLPRLGCQTVPQGPGYPCELAFVIPASHPAVSRYARAWKSLETLEVLISSKAVTLRPSR